jgi:hypothetical protein
MRKPLVADCSTHTKPNILLSNANAENETIIIFTTLCTKRTTEVNEGERVGERNECDEDDLKSDFRKTMPEKGRGCTLGRRVQTFLDARVV